MKHFITILALAALTSTAHAEGPLKVDDAFKSEAKPAVQAAPAQPQAPAAAAPQSSAKIGVVDVLKLAKGSAEGQKTTAALKEKYTKFQGQLKKKEKALETLKSSIEKKASEMTLAQRSVKAKEFEKGLKEYQQAAKKAEKELLDQEEAATKKILEKIKAIIEDYGKKNGFTAIVTKGNLVYNAASEPVDVTEELLKQMK